MIPPHEILEALPVPVYMTDAEGFLTFYNEAAAAFWGCRPELGTSRWCGLLRLYWPDGRPMAHSECPMAVALREGRPVRGAEAVAERPDGARVPFVSYPTPLRDAAGRVVGAINLLIDSASRKTAEIESARLAAIVSSSEDAIIGKTLEGVVTYWNAGATRIFGYEAEEMVGQPIIRIIPSELHREEEGILARLQRGERIEHFDTVRIGKDGRRIDVSLTISPMHDRAGNIIGASKIARDITVRKESEQLQRLLFDELNHRVKNSLAMIQAIASQSLRRAQSPEHFVASFNGRLSALAKAHDLLVEQNLKGAEVAEIVREQVALGAEGDRMRSVGPKVMLDARTVVQLALLLHELATNARKHGALSVPAGQLSVSWMVENRAGRELVLDWKESGVPNVGVPASRGFGMVLIERAVRSDGGEATIDFGTDGVVCRLRIPLREKGERAAGNGAPQPSTDRAPAPAARRILLIEDEPLVALEIESQLRCAGYEVIGPAGTVNSARRLAEDTVCDAALVDASLNGYSVDEVAGKLMQRGIPFGFVTGFSREGVPRGFQNAGILTKPFDQDDLLAFVAALLSEETPREAVSPGAA
jgi:PAS domain S-box-containing protein